MASHHRAPVSDDDLKRATDVVERYYFEWTAGAAQNLAERVLNGEIDDSESLQERLHEDCDSAMTYYKDQSLVLFASNSVDAGADEMQDMGGGGDNPQTVLAFLTFQIDVRERLDSLGLGGDFTPADYAIEVMNGEHDEDLLVWLVFRLFDPRTNEGTLEGLDLSADQRLELLESAAERAKEIVAGRYGSEAAVRWDKAGYSLTSAE